MSRSYSRKDIELLWGLAAARCSYPNCRIECVVPGNDLDKTAMIGKIAHIVAHSENGPRGDPSYPNESINSYDNLILLCSNHHDMVDAQFNTFTVHDLRQWKTDHETWVRTKLTNEMPFVGFAELEIVSKAILSRPSEPSVAFRLTDPKQKMIRNHLTDKILHYVQIGSSKAKEVEMFVQNMSMLDPKFPERLIAGFAAKYSDLREEGLDGDALFETLHGFSSGGSHEFLKQAAGLAILIYLFEKCEVFEP
ncbi:MAG: HNH endonuclease [Methanothrix sp.]|nr:HNH endonuclease [Methanothrix sp.]